MRVRACIRCSLPLEPRSITIGDRTHRAWVRVCHCQGVTGCGWYFRVVSDTDDDIPAFDDPIPAKPVVAPDIFVTAEPLTERRYA